MNRDHEASVSRFRPQAMVSLWIVLFALWMMVNSSLAIEIAAVGAPLTLVLAVIFTSWGPAWDKIRWTPRAFVSFLAYTGIFVVELVRANLQMMRYVYSPRIDIKPGIVKVRTRLKSPIGRMVLANSIALTPGSLVIDIEGDDMFIHWLDVKTTDIDEATAMIVGPFEKKLEDVFG